MFVHLTPCAGAPAARSARRDGRPRPALPARRAAVRARRSRTTSRATGRSSPRTTTSATTAPRCTRSCATSSPRSGAAVPSWDGSTASRSARAPGRSRRHGTSERAPFEGLDDGRARTPQGRAGLPQPAAEHVGRARRGVQPAARADRPRHTWCAICCSTPTRSPGRRSTRPTRATCGTSSTVRTGRICESVQRGMTSRAWTGGWFAPMEDESADISRWYAASMAEATGSGVDHDPGATDGSDDGLADGLDDG